jgi:hypothetical protein
MKEKTTLFNKLKGAFEDSFAFAEQVVTTTPDEIKAKKANNIMYILSCILIIHLILLCLQYYKFKFDKDKLLTRFNNLYFN